jgi:NhaA family Na+:H+ antiporter
LLTFFKVERNAALLLLAAGILGLIVANTSAAEFVSAIGDQQLTILGFDLDLRGFVGEFLMTGFFMLIGLELKRELHSGIFRDRRAIALPAMSALLGALVPAAVFFALVGTHTDASGGWPIPMATDVTFALAIFTVFAKSMPASARTFLLSFAVIDDVIAIAVIAIFLGSGLNFAYLVAAVFTIWAYAYVSRLSGLWGALSAIVVATAAWSFTALAGISPVVVGVALGLFTSASRVEAVEKRLPPWVAMLVLPLFAFFASGVSLAGGLAITSAMTLAILSRPLGKIIGINFGAALARILVKNSGFDDLRPAQIARISTLGGIGFTVALLISNQIFGSGSELASQAIIATLVAMLVSMVVGAVALSWRRT